MKQEFIMPFTSKQVFPAAVFYVLPSNVKTVFLTCRLDNTTVRPRTFIGQADQGYVDMALEDTRGIREHF